MNDSNATRNPGEGSLDIAGDAELGVVKIEGAVLANDNTVAHQHSITTRYSSGILGSVKVGQGGIECHLNKVTSEVANTSVLESDTDLD